MGKGNDVKLGKEGGKRCGNGIEGGDGGDARKKGKGWRAHA